MYGNYRGKCIGRLLHFLCEYRIRDYDVCIFDSGSNSITVRNKLLATYEWDKDEQGNETDVPTFEFFGEAKKFWTDAQVHYKPQVLKDDEMYNKIFSHPGDTPTVFKSEVR